MNRSLRRPLVLLAALVLGLLATLTPGGTAVAAGGKPAPVKITLKSDGTGRVVSDREACKSEVDVFAFYRGSNGAITGGGQTTTDDRGRYPTGGARRGVAARAFTFVLGSAKCRLAQSDDAPILMRAGKPAQREVTLKAGPTGLSGRVSSKRAGCFKSVPVEVFAQLGPDQPWTDLGALVTDDQGRYDTSETRLPGTSRGMNAKVAAVTLGTKTCRVAQSPIRTVPVG